MSSIAVSQEAINKLLLQQTEDILSAENSVLGTYYIDLNKLKPHPIQRPIDENHCAELGKMFMANPSVRDLPQNTMFVVAVGYSTKEEVQKALVKMTYDGKDYMVFPFEVLCIAGNHRAEAALKHMGGITYHHFWKAKFYLHGLDFSIYRSVSITNL